VSAGVKPTKLLLAAAMLTFGLTACGADNPPGTISEDDLPGGVDVDKIRHDDQAGQVVCPDVNNAEDNYVMTPSENYDKDRRAAVSYELSGSHNEIVSNSVWRVTHPKERLDRVEAGLDKCMQAQPDVYQRFDVEGYPDAIGYTEEGGAPETSYTRRILVPVDDRVVIVTSTREGGDEFAVPPEDLLKKAVDASSDAPQA
jgi:hypothetical protein